MHLYNKSLVFHIHKAYRHPTCGQSPLAADTVASQPLQISLRTTHDSEGVLSTRRSVMHAALGW